MKRTLQANYLLGVLAAVLGLVAAWMDDRNWTAIGGWSTVLVWTVIAYLWHSLAVSIRKGVRADEVRVWVPQGVDERELANRIVDAVRRRER